jgi:hypothetical protein
MADIKIGDAVTAMDPVDFQIKYAVVTDSIVQGSTTYYSVIFIKNGVVSPLRWLPEDNITVIV